ncbi:sugar ABC transporter substrate-binding protein [Amycolatopsis thermoflava]|uniref:ABC-type sugar transport system substrate-binding protein n=1 Tax=Amycolatopsis thermoflava TaxID=84480 RepID=A0A3N2H4Y7_9PSEU|nr:sugar ABC transporter substrate-binding protein [Amycolatopsis thermoflava]ROS43971.1 ABC-type sugar transport system substrate-binding protein [Amycolatopsis thermoflava]
MFTTSFGSIERRRPGRLATLGSAAVVAGALLAGCGAQNDAASGDSKLIVFALSFPCQLNDYATRLCDGVNEAAKSLPAGFRVDVKTGVNYGDNVAFNNLIQTSVQLRPAGLIVFPSGPAAQTPVLNQACARDIKVIIIDSPADGVKCQSSFVGANHRQLGELAGQWLVAHPPAGKEVGVVALPPGQYTSNDDRVKGFTETVEAAGYQVVADVTTDLGLDSTRRGVTNMVTAHPGLGAVFSANSQIGQGTAQALKGNRQVVQLTADGSLTNVPSILDGTISADAAQDPYGMGRTAVEYMVKVIQGQEVPPITYTRAEVVDKDNAQAYLQAGGLK